jgi:hypothetical protein
MTYSGHVKDGVVVLDPPVRLPEWWVSCLQISSRFRVLCG